MLGGITIRSTIEKNRLELVAQKQEERNDAEATRLVEGLLQADTSRVKAIIEGLSDFGLWAKDDLQRAYSESPEDSNARLHTALAMPPHDKHLTEIQSRLSLRDSSENNIADFLTCPRLRLHPTKTTVFPVTQGIRFLGYRPHHSDPTIRA